MREFKRIDPLDLNKDQGIGVFLPFGERTIFNTTFETKDALKTNLVNFLLTQPGERYLNPSIGTPLRSLLFENLTPGRLETVKEFIRERIEDTFIRVNVVDLVFSVKENSLLVELKYSIQDTDVEDEIIVNIES